MFDLLQEIVVVIPKVYLNEGLNGLCGNFDHDQSNEFTINGEVNYKNHLLLTTIKFNSNSFTCSLFL